MSYILAIDTSSNYCSASIVTEEGLLADSSVETVTNQYNLIFDQINKVLKKCNFCIQDIDAYGVCIGPGNFTGIRISLSIVKGISFASGKPAIGISAFECLAFPYKTCSVIIKGGQDYFYTQTFEENISVNEPKLTKQYDLEKNLKLNKFPLIGFNAEQLARKLKMSFFSDSTLISTHILGNITLKKIKNEKKELKPLYIKQGV